MCESHFTIRQHKKSAYLFSFISGTTENANVPDVDPDNTTNRQRPGQPGAETGAKESVGAEIKEKEVVEEDVEGEKRRVLRLKMRRLGERLYPEEGMSALDPYSRHISPLLRVFRS